MEMYQGDLDPALALTLADDEGPMDLTMATDVRLVARDAAGAIAFTRTESLDELTADAQGRVVMPWVAGDTATVGRLTLQVVIDWPTGPQTVDIDEVVEIRAVRQTGLVTVDEVIDHMSGISLTAPQRDACRRILAGCERGLERKLYRKFTAATATETVTADESGWAPLSRTPVIGIDAIDGAAVLPLPGPYEVTRNGVFLGWPGQQVTITYRGGFDVDPDELADVRLAIMEKVGGVVTVRHDDTLSVKELDTKDAVEMARKVAATWSDEEITPFDRLRRRVVV